VWPIADFQRTAKKIFPGRCQKCGNFIFPLETEKATFSAKHFIENCQISKSKGDQGLPFPSFNAHA